MINVNTLNKLDKLCIGSSVDKLENYVAMIYYSELMGNCIISDKTEREEVVELLRQLKPNSNILKFDFGMEKYDMTDKDIFLDTYGAFRGEKVNNLDNINYYGLEQSMEKESEDLVGVVLGEGIDIRIVYYNGILFQATTFCNDEKGKDITKHIRELVPNNVDNISRNGITEIHGRLSIADDIIVKDKLNTIVEYLVKEADERIKDIFVVKVYKIYCEEIEFTALNKEIDFMEENGFDTADYLLIRNITSNDLEQAINSMYDSLIETDGALELRLCINTNNAFQYPFENRDDILIINRKLITNKLYRSTITNINWVLKTFAYAPRLLIKAVKTDTGVAVRYIDIDNVNILDNNNITIGSDIYFYINYKNEIIPCDNEGNRLE